MRAADIVRRIVKWALRAPTPQVNAEFFAQRARAQQYALVQDAHAVISRANYQQRDGGVMVLGLPGINPFYANPDSCRKAILHVYPEIISYGDIDMLVQHAMKLANQENKRDRRERMREKRDYLND